MWASAVLSFLKTAIEGKKKRKEKKKKNQVFFFSNFVI
jgi:hypothetical protein